MKLGKRPARLNMRRRAAALTILPHLPAPSASVDNYNGHTGWGEMLNDQLGDCTIASVGHAIQIVTLQTGSMITPPDASLLRYYQQWAGYQPGNPNSDQGAYEDDVLNAWQRDSFDGHTLLSWLDVNPRNIEHVKQCIEHFGFVIMGAELPMVAAEQDVWDVVPADHGPWGGHAMTAGKYDADGIYLITWGRVMKATWAWWLKYVDECHGCLAGDWLAHFPGVASTVLINMLKAME